MNNTRVSHQPIACLNLVLERNNQLFSEAHSLSCDALNILDRPYLDAEAFSQYQEKRRHADLKFHDAIEHLRLLMTQYHIPPAHRTFPTHKAADFAGAVKDVWFNREREMGSSCTA